MKHYLSQKEHRALQVLERMISENPYPPTIREYMQELGLTSSSTAYGYLERLEKKGYIKRGESSPRAIEVIQGTWNY